MFTYHDHQLSSIMGSIIGKCHWLERWSSIQHVLKPLIQSSVHDSSAYILCNACIHVYIYIFQLNERIALIYYYFTMHWLVVWIFKVELFRLLFWDIALSKQMFCVAMNQAISLLYAMHYMYGNSDKLLNAMNILNCQTT